METREGRKISCPKCSSLIAEPETPLYQCPVCSSLFLGKTAKRSSGSSSSRSSGGSSRGRNAGHHPGADAPKARLISEATNNFSGNLSPVRGRKNEQMQSGEAVYYEPWSISPSVWPKEGSVDSLRESKTEDFIRHGSRGAYGEQVKNRNMDGDNSKNEATYKASGINRLFDLSMFGISDDVLIRNEMDEMLSRSAADVEKTSIHLEYSELDSENISVKDEKMHEENAVAGKELSSSGAQEENVDKSDLVRWGINTKDVELLSNSVSHSGLLSEEEINYEEISYVDVSFDQWKNEQAENTNEDNIMDTASESSSNFYFTESNPNSVGSNASIQSKQSPWKIRTQNSSVSDVSKKNPQTGYPLPAPNKSSMLEAKPISVRQRRKAVSQPLYSTQNIGSSDQSIDERQDLNDRKNPETNNQQQWSNMGARVQPRAEVSHNNLSTSHQSRKRFGALPRAPSVGNSTALVEKQKDEQVEVSSHTAAMSTAEFLSSHHCIICIHEQFHVKKTQDAQVHSHHESVQKGSKKAKRYPPLPRNGVPHYVLCRHCGLMLEVPVGVTPSEGSVQRLRCSSCGKISKFKVLVQGNSPSLGIVSISATANRNSTDEFASGILSQLEVSEQLPKDPQNIDTNNNPTHSADLYPSYRFDAKGKRSGRSESGGYLSASSSGSSGSYHSRLQKQQAIISRQNDNAEEECTFDKDDPNETRQSFCISPDRFSRSSSDRDENEVVVAPGSPLIEHFAHAVGNVSARTYERRLLRAVNVSARSNASSASSSIYDHHDTNESPLVMSQGSGSGKGAKYYAGLISKGIKELGKGNQVVVNGHVIKKEAIYRAQEKAGFILPGSYWYDYQAGFWGVMGGPCLGIVLPCIEEFNFPMAKDCSDGNTRILVNGRELHEKDLAALAKRGLSTTPDKSYKIDINGQVFDPASGQLLRTLGRLAPSVLKNAQGFGMFQPAS